jgi:hypothetical protein
MTKTVGRTLFSIWLDGLPCPRRSELSTLSPYIRQSDLELASRIRNFIRSAFLGNQNYNRI